MEAYYQQRADAWLIITEGTSPSPNGLGYPRIPGAYSDEQVAGWKKTTDAVHATEGKIFLQIMHTDRVSHSLNMPEGARVLAPSAVGLTQEKMYTDAEGPQDYPTPQEMTIVEIHEDIDEYVYTAKQAIKAGFDGVELYVANGYLINQFISPITNKREDKYGGSVDNRLRFALEIAEKTVAAIGKERVGIRISSYGVFNGLGTFKGIEETYEILAKKVNGFGLVYLHLVDHSAMGAPEVPDAIKKLLRKNFKNTFILSGGYDAERAEKDLQADKGDLIAFGRPFISNPDLVTRMKEGIELTQPNPDTFYTPGKGGYTDYGKAELKTA
jgi:N-ethylmaleimide reductase